MLLSRALAFYFLLGIGLIQSSQAMANHAKGLHLQLPSQLIDIKATDIQTVQVFANNSNSVMIMLRLKPNKGEYLQKVTQTQLGQPVTWIWNGRVLAIETLNTPLSAEFTVCHFTPAEAEEFKKTISANGINITPPD